MLTGDRTLEHFIRNTTVKLDLQFKFGQQKRFAQSCLSATNIICQVPDLRHRKQQNFSL